MADSIESSVQAVLDKLESPTLRSLDDDIKRDVQELSSAFRTEARAVIEDNNVAVRMEFKDYAYDAEDQSDKLTINQRSKKK